MMAMVPSTAQGASTSTFGSNSMPTETKNSTAKASRIGSESCAAWWLNSDSLSSMPAKNAPSAKLTPNSSAEPNATPIAIDNTASVNSSREPVPAMRSSTHGIALRPTISMKATKAATLPKVIASALAISPAPTSSPPPRAPASAGISTSAITQARSSTISQPTAILPRRVSSRRRSSIARSSTTVLAVASEKPKIKPSICRQPISSAMPQPSRVAIAICPTAPGMAMFFTDIRSRSEKCRPTPNISRITPISASCGASSGSPTKPGVNGPASTPASR